MTGATRRAKLEAERMQLSMLLSRELGALERVGLEARMEELMAELAALGAEAGTKQAEADLVFYGDPVVGADGIDAVFASEVLKSYQDIVVKVHASQESVLLGGGPVRNEHEAHLHVTGAVHGSFGFQLRELAASPTPPQTAMFDKTTSLYAAVEETANLIESAGKDDDAFLDAVQDFHPRVQDAIRRFFSTVQDGGATFRLATATRTTDFDYERIAGAVARTSVMWQDERTERMLGTFGGMLPDSRAFEHRLESGVTIKGRAAPALPMDSVAPWYLQRCIAVVRVKRWQRGGREFRRYTLLELAPPDHSTPQGRLPA